MDRGRDTVRSGGSYDIGHWLGWVERQRLRHDAVRHRWYSATAGAGGYHFFPAEARGAVAAKAVQRIVDWFCNGSVEEVLIGMVDNAVLDPKQLQLLSDKIAKAKARKK